MRIEGVLRCVLCNRAGYLLVDNVKTIDNLQWLNFPSQHLHEVKGL